MTMKSQLLDGELQGVRDRRTQLSTCHVRAAMALTGWFWLGAVVFFR
jgi:hypothetical protein